MSKCKRFRGFIQSLLIIYGNICKFFSQKINAPIFSDFGIVQKAENGGRGQGAPAGKRDARIKQIYFIRSVTLQSLCRNKLKGY